MTARERPEGEDVPEPAPGAALGPAHAAAQNEPSEPEDWSAAAASFVERFAADMTEAGMQRMASRVFACLLASREGSLSSAQLADRLRISPAAVSGAVRYLSQVRMVSREREPGSRRELYRVHENIWYEALLDRDKLVGRWAGTLRDGEQALGTDTPAGRRLKETYDFLEFMQSELEQMLHRWRAHRAARDEGTPGDEPPRHEPPRGERARGEPDVKQGE